MASLENGDSVALSITKYDPVQFELVVRRNFEHALGHARQRVEDPVSQIKINKQRASTIDPKIVNKLADDMIKLCDSQSALYENWVYQDSPEDSKRTSPHHVIVSQWHRLVKVAHSQLDRHTLFLVGSQILVKDRHRSLLFKELTRQFVVTSLFFRHQALKRSVEKALFSWKQTPHIEDAFVVEIDHIVLENKQPVEEKSQYIKTLKAKFDSLRYLRILAKLSDMERMLEIEERNLKTMPVQSDSENIDEVRRKFVGSKEVFLKHFHEHSERLKQYRSNLEKYLKYQQDAATHASDAIRYFHALYVDGKSIVDAYQRFDQRVDRQLNKIDSKISASRVLDSDDDMKDNTNGEEYPIPQPISRADIEIITPQKQKQITPTETPVSKIFANMRNSVVVKPTSPNVMPQPHSHHQHVTPKKIYINPATSPRSQHVFINPAHPKAAQYRDGTIPFGERTAPVGSIQEQIMDRKKIESEKKTPPPPAAPAHIAKSFPPLPPPGKTVLPAGKSVPPPPLPPGGAKQPPSTVLQDINLELLRKSVLATQKSTPQSKLAEIAETPRVVRTLSPASPPHEKPSSEMHASPEARRVIIASPNADDIEKPPPLIQRISRSGSGQTSPTRSQSPPLTRTIDVTDRSRSPSPKTKLPTGKIEVEKLPITITQELRKSTIFNYQSSSLRAESIRKTAEQARKLIRAKDEAKNEITEEMDASEETRLKTTKKEPKKEAKRDSKRDRGEKPSSTRKKKKKERSEESPGRTAKKESASKERGERASRRGRDKSAASSDRKKKERKDRSNSRKRPEDKAQDAVQLFQNLLENEDRQSPPKKKPRSKDRRSPPRRSRHVEKETPEFDEPPPLPPMEPPPITPSPKEKTPPRRRSARNHPEPRSVSPKPVKARIEKLDRTGKVISEKVVTHGDKRPEPVPPKRRHTITHGKTERERSPYDRPRTTLRGRSPKSKKSKSVDRERSRSPYDHPRDRANMPKHRPEAQERGRSPTRKKSPSPVKDTGAVVGVVKSEEGSIGNSDRSGSLSPLSGRSVSADSMDSGSSNTKSRSPTPDSVLESRSNSSDDSMSTSGSDSESSKVEVQTEQTKAPVPVLPFSALPIPGPNSLTLPVHRPVPPPLPTASITSAAPLPLPNINPVQHMSVTLNNVSTPPTAQAAREEARAIYLRGVNQDIDNATLMKALKAVGADVAKCHLPQDSSRPKGNKGYAFVHLQSESTAAKLVSEGFMDLGTDGHGRMLGACEVQPYRGNLNVYEARAKSPRSSRFSNPRFSPSMPHAQYRPRGSNPRAPRPTAPPPLPTASMAPNQLRMPDPMPAPRVKIPSNLPGNLPTTEQLQSLLAHVKTPTATVTRVAENKSAKPAPPLPPPGSTGKPSISDLPQPKPFSRPPMPPGGPGRPSLSPGALRPPLPAPGSFRMPPPLQGVTPRSGPPMPPRSGGVRAMPPLPLPGLAPPLPPPGLGKPIPTVEPIDLTSSPGRRNLTPPRSSKAPPPLPPPGGSNKSPSMGMMSMLKTVRNNSPVSRGKNVAFKAPIATFQESKKPQLQKATTISYDRMETEINTGSEPPPAMPATAKIIFNQPKQKVLSINNAFMEEYEEPTKKRRMGLNKNSPMFKQLQKTASREEPKKSDEKQNDSTEPSEESLVAS